MLGSRPLTELDRWLDLEVALEDDCVEALQTKMEFHGIDVHMTVGFYVPWSDDKWLDITVTANRTALSLAVLHGAVNCVAYLKEMGARSDHLGSYYDIGSDWLGYVGLMKELDELEQEEAKERWANFASNRLGLAKSFAKDIFDGCCSLAHPDPPHYTCVSANHNLTINGQDISDWYEKLDCHDYCAATFRMYCEAKFNALQLATFKYGRDALITRLVRGETREKIAKSYKLGFAALRYYADSQRASLLLAKNDGRLWLILKILATLNMPPELRQKIVDFAFFGKKP